ncbi:MAG: protein kinase domain-containing protein [Planctomycetota bacterium]
MRIKCPSCSKTFRVGGQAAGRVHCPHCRQKLDLARMARPEDLQRGDRLGGCRIEGLLGRGGMAVVYKATQLSLDRPVALKVLPRGLARDRQFVERFNREASALARLSHPNIVGILDKGVEDETYYFVMEYVPGPTLGDHLRRHGPMAPEDALELMHGICSALEYAHETGIVHRDLKPSNILLDPNGAPKLADFGIARIVGGQTTAHRELTMAHAAMGSADYMAPEQREDAASVDHRADIYALGVLLYQSLTGHLPVGTFTPASRLVAAVPVAVDRVIRKALANAPDDRFESVALFRAALAQALTTDRTHIPTAGRRHPRRSSRTTQALLIAGIVTACGVFGALLIARDRGNGKAVQPPPALPTDTAPEKPPTKPPTQAPTKPPTASRPEKPPTKPPTSATPEEPQGESEAVEEALADVRSYIAQNPAHYQGQLDRLTEIIVSHNDLDVVRAAKEEREAIIRNLHTEIDETLAQLTEQADALADKGSYGAALRIFESFPPYLRTEDSVERLNAAIEKIKTRARNAFAQRQARARKLVEQGKAAEAVALLQEAKDWRLPAITQAADEELASLQDAIAAQRQRIAREQYELRRDLAAKMKAHWAKRQYADALALAKQALEQAPDAPSRAALQRYHRAASLLAEFWIAVHRGARKSQGKTLRINDHRWTLVGLKNDSLVLATGGGAGQGRVTNALRGVAPRVLTTLAFAVLDAQKPEPHLMAGLLHTYDEDGDPARARKAFETARARGARRGDIEALRTLGVEKAPQAPTPQPEPEPKPEVAGFALDFDGNAAYVEVPDRRPHALHLTKSFTVEAWVWWRPRGGEKLQYVLAKNLGWDRSETYGIALRNRHWVYTTGFGDEQDIRECKATCPPGQWVHVALVCAGLDRAFFVDGKLVDKSRARRAWSYDDKPLTLGAEYERNTLSFFFNGAIDEVRISAGPRYRKDFTPQRRFERDRRTVLLFHCDEGEGPILRDSGAAKVKNHGRIVGARFVKPDDLRLPPPPGEPQPPGREGEGGGGEG